MLKNILFSLSKIAPIPIFAVESAASIFCLVNSSSQTNEYEKIIPDYFLDIREEGTILCGFKSNVTSVLLYNGIYTTLKIPEGIKEIEPLAFNNMFEETTTFMRKIVFPSTLEKIGSSAFEGDTGIREINLDDTSIKEIGSRAFRQTGLTHGIVFPNTLEIIGESAFEYCRNLTQTIIFGENIKSIGICAFKDCYKISTIDLSRMINCPIELLQRGNIFQNLGTDSESTNKIAYFPSKTTYSYDMWYDILYNRQSLPKITEKEPNAFRITSKKIIPELSLHIWHGKLLGFYGDIDLSKFDVLEIPDEVTEIGDNAFYDDKTSTSKIVDCNIEIWFNDNLSFIGSYAFYGCTGLRGPLFLNSVSDIGEYAFSGCTGITGELKLTPTLNNIGSSAFINCVGITSLVFESEFLVISSAAFAFCSGICSMDISIFKNQPPLSWYTSDTEPPESKETDIFYKISDWGCFYWTKSDLSNDEEQDKWYAFFFSRGINSCGPDFPDKQWKFVYYDTEHYLDELDFSCNYNGSTLYGLSRKGKQEDLQDVSLIAFDIRTQKIYPNAFNQTFCASDTKQWFLSLNKGLIEIGDNAFSNNTNLFGGIYLPETVEKIGDYAFANCSNLNGAFELNKSLITIGAHAFEGCNNLTFVKLSDNIRNIGKQAFSNVNLDCTFLTKKPVGVIDDEAFHVDDGKKIKVWFNWTQGSIVSVVKTFLLQHGLSENKFEVCYRL